MYSLKCLVWFLSLLHSTHCGRRYGIQDNAIVSLPMFKTPLEYEESHSTSDMSTAPDALMMMDLFTTATARSEWHWSENPILGHDIKMYAMVSLGETSIFGIGPNGNVYERFFTGFTWTFFLHTGPTNSIYRPLYYEGMWSPSRIPNKEMGPVVAITGVEMTGVGDLDFHGYIGIFVSTENGNLYQRESIGDRVLKWIDVSLKNDRIVKSGVVGRSGRTFFVTEGGALMEMLFATHSWAKYDCEFNLLLVVDVMNMKENSVFVMSDTFTLWELDMSTLLWKKHLGPEPGFTLLAQPACSVSLSKAKELLDTRSIFFLSSIGLVEYNYDSVAKKFIWYMYGYPTTGSETDEPPPALASMSFSYTLQRLFFVNGDRRLYAFEMAVPVWIDLRSPVEEASLSLPLSADVGSIQLVRPLVIDQPSFNEAMVVLVQEDGHLAIYSSIDVNGSTTGKWEIHHVPEYVL